VAITSFTGEYRFLSNFWYVPEGIELKGALYPTVEHAYQAAKTIIPEERLRIYRVPYHKPGEAKKLGRTLTIREDLEAIKLVVM
jgi:N-glycosidase YbiA